MEKKDVIAFFDRLAPTWDGDMVPKDQIIRRILDNAQIGEGMDVLDVACGTGVMFPFYLERKAASITGVDISPEMAKIAEEKFEAFPEIHVVCGDVEHTVFDRKFDAVVVYNAFPHFPNPEALIQILAALLKDGGRLTIAHSMSREQVNDHHKGAASKVSHGLMEVQDLKVLFAPYFDTDIVISNDEMYQVSGTKVK